MPVCYDSLWKLLIDKKLKRTDLKRISGISGNVLAKLGKDEPVSMDSLEKYVQHLIVILEILCFLLRGIIMRYKNTGKVKENGVVYTPIEIANYISEELIRINCPNNKKTIIVNAKNVFNFPNQQFSAFWINRVS